MARANESGRALWDLDKKSIENLRRSAKRIDFFESIIR